MLRDGSWAPAAGAVYEHPFGPKSPKATPLLLRVVLLGPTLKGQSLWLVWHTTVVYERPLSGVLYIACRIRRSPPTTEMPALLQVSVLQIAYEFCVPVCAWGLAGKF